MEPVSVGRVCIDVHPWDDGRAIVARIDAAARHLLAGAS